MNDRLEDELVEWLRERGMPDPVAMSDVTASLDRLPDRRSRRSGWIRAATAAVVVIAGIGAAVVVPRLAGPSVGPAQPVLPDPASFANDPRLQVCGAASDGLLTVFEMAHVSDYQRHLPNAYPLVGLDVAPAEPALVLVYAGPSTGGRLPLSASPTPSPSPREHDICMVVGDEPSAWAPIAIARVDITGLISVLPTELPVDASRSVPSPTSTASSVGDAPVPAWTADIGGQLECDGPAPGLGGEVGELGAWEPGPTPDAALQILLDARAFASLPAGGFDPAVVEGHWARHEYRVDGRVRAIAVTTDRGDGFPEGLGWSVVGLRACDAAEFDPADGLTFDQTLWRDRAGTIERSDRIHSAPGPGHCDWESTIFLRFEDVQYIRDPLGVLADATVAQFDADVALPDDAVDTGLHTEEWRLHTTADDDSIYVVTRAGSVERWGRAKDQIACM